MLRLVPHRSSRIVFLIYLYLFVTILNTSNCNILRKHRKQLFVVTAFRNRPSHYSFQPPSSFVTNNHYHPKSIETTRTTDHYSTRCRHGGARFSFGSSLSSCSLMKSSSLLSSSSSLPSLSSLSSSFSSMNENNSNNNNFYSHNSYHHHHHRRRRHGLQPMRQQRRKMTSLLFSYGRWVPSVRHFSTSVLFSYGRWVPSVRHFSTRIKLLQQLLSVSSSGSDSSDDDIVHEKTKNWMKRIVAWFMKVVTFPWRVFSRLLRKISNSSGKNDREKAKEAPLLSAIKKSYQGVDEDHFVGTNGDSSGSVITSTPTTVTSTNKASTSTPTTPASVTEMQTQDAAVNVNVNVNDNDNNNSGNNDELHQPSQQEETLSPAATTTTTTTSTSSTTDTFLLPSRSDIANPKVDLSGNWQLIVTKEFKEEYDEYLKRLGQSSIVRSIALSIIGMTTEETKQSDDGKTLFIRGKNVRGVWERTLIASSQEDPQFMDVTTADSEKVKSESWWENNGTVHRSWMRGIKKYNGGDFESKRYVISDPDPYQHNNKQSQPQSQQLPAAAVTTTSNVNTPTFGNVLVCETTFHPNDPNKPKAKIVWKFLRDDNKPLSS